MHPSLTERPRDTETRRERERERERKRERELYTSISERERERVGEREEIWVRALHEPGVGKPIPGGHMQPAEPSHLVRAFTRTKTFPKTTFLKWLPNTGVFEL